MFFRRRQENDNFFTLLHDQGCKTLEGLEALCCFATENSQASADKVKNIEREADDIRRIIIDRLNHTFITPIDREDIFALSRAIDDVMDYANTTVYEMQIYKVKADAHIMSMIGILKEGSLEIAAASKNLKAYPNVAMEHAKKAKAAENRIEEAYRASLAQLFEGDDPVYMMKMREVYRHLSNAADRCDEAADIVADIVVKMT